MYKKFAFKIWWQCSRVKDEIFDIILALIKEKKNQSFKFLMKTQDGKNHNFTAENQNQIKSFR
jgi:hypothetical protein